MSYDLVIKNGVVVDGTGAKRYQADVALADGKVVEIGKVTERCEAHHRRRRSRRGAGLRRPAHALRRTDLLGRRGDALVVARRHFRGGWAIAASASRPASPAAREIAMKDLGERRGHSVRCAEQGHHLGLGDLPAIHGRRAAARKPSLNLAFIAPLTPFRHYVMGEASMDRAATAEETAKIAALIGEAMDAGALGFSLDHAQPAYGLRGQAAGLP